MLLKNKLDKLRKTLSNNNVLTTLEERYCYAKDASNTKSKYSLLLAIITSSNWNLYYSMEKLSVF